MVKFVGISGAIRSILMVTSGERGPSFPKASVLETANFKIVLVFIGAVT